MGNWSWTVPFLLCLLTAFVDYDTDNTVTPAPSPDVTALLTALKGGDKNAEERLMSLVYDQLKAMASRLLQLERAGHTLQTTALVHEAYLRLVGSGERDYANRAHFFAVAAHVMRHVLIDYARARAADRRGGQAPHLSLDDVLIVSEDRLEQLLILDEALQKLARVDPRSSRTFVLRFYGGLAIEDIAEVLQVSARTVKRDWSFGRAWLRSALGAAQNDVGRTSSSD
jgi:RNA polymerase sigma-70 factor, ECF subfamily